MSKFYITTAIHYVNDLPHIGHMYENVVADVIARHRRRMGDDVFFLTGTDEHGQKIERSAARDGVAPINLADRVVRHHQELWKTLNISHDDFIRTTQERHKTGVYALIRRIREKNPDDIYLGEHSGWYCQSEETFVPENQVKDKRDESGHAVEWTTEKNYFFRLSRYTQPLLDHYRNNPGFVTPGTRLNEIVSFVEQGLKDLSISRTSIKWGLPFPGDPAMDGGEHIIYVWMDALTNYISALGFGSENHEAFDRYWPADIHLIGKDITRFHAVYWPAFLMAAGIELPKRVVAHGWWLRDNEKISKSVGNVVAPHNIIEDFGADPFRYFLLREMVFGQDQNYSDESFIGRYNADLANDLGNTMSRALKMSAQYFDGHTPPIRCYINDVRDAADQAVEDYLKAMEELAFQRALDAIWRLLTAINSYIVTREPWRRFKEAGADGALARILWSTLEGLRVVWVMMAPFMPETSRKALALLAVDPDGIKAGDLAWGSLSRGATISSTDPIFPRIDSAAYIQTPAVTKESPKMEEKPPPADAGAPIETTQAMPPDVSRITIDQFMETDLRVAEILSAEKVEKSKKLMKLRVSTGDGERTIVAGIASRYAPEELVGRKVVIVANLQPATLMGVESNGMVLAASIDGQPSLLAVDPSVPAGTRVR